MTGLSYYQRYRGWILNKAKDYYKTDNERLKEQARDKYRNSYEKDKNKKTEYGRNWYLNNSEEEKRRLKEYQKNYCKAKSLNLIINIFYGFNNVCCDLIMRY